MWFIWVVRAKGNSIASDFSFTFVILCTENVWFGFDFRLINGVFENYLGQRADGNFFAIVEAGEWFCFTDMLHTQIQTIQNYTVYPYLPYGFAAWHLLFAGISWPKITFPTQGFEVNRFWFE